MSLVFEGSEIGEIRVGSQNTNCIISTPKNIKLDLDSLGVTIVGSPTINKGVVNGFSTANYVSLPKTIPLSTASSVEIVVRVKDNVTSGYQMLIGNSTDTASGTGFCIRTNGGVRLYFWATTDNSSWAVSIFDTGVDLSTDYRYVRMSYTPTKVTFSWSTDGSNWTTANSKDITALTNHNSLRFGESGTAYYLNGSIDLPNSYIKVNGQDWWKGGTGTLTLKAGSKVYVPNGFNTDGSKKFDEVVVANDTYQILNDMNVRPFFYSPSAKVMAGFQAHISGTAPTITSGNQIVYRTDTNVIEQYTNGTLVRSDFSLPFCLGTGTSQINQIFDWCGYVGSTAFTLPDVKGYIPNGFNDLGTYKSIEFTTDKVSVSTIDSNWDSQDWFVYPDSALAWYPLQAGEVSYSQSENVWKDTRVETGTEMWFPVAHTTSTDGKITSLTPASVQPTTTSIIIGEIYNGSDLVWQYNSYEPGTILLDQATAGTYTIHLKKGRYFISLTGAGGQASGGYYYFCFQNSGGSGGTVKGDFYVTKETDVTVVVGAGASGTGQASTLSVGGTTMMTANGGNYCHANGSCGGNTGGSASFSLSGVLTNKTLQAVTGNAGRYDLNQAIGGLSNDAVDTQRGRGANSAACTVVYGQPGGVQIKYLSMKK